MVVGIYIHFQTKMVGKSAKEVEDLKARYRYRKLVETP